MVFLMLLFSVDYYLVAKIQRIYETTKFKIKNNTRDAQKYKLLGDSHQSLVISHLKFGKCEFY